MTERDRLLGTVVDVEVGPPAHGGFCVARVDGLVVFVRHALPGERVRALVTEDAGGSFVRADAVEVLLPSPDRVPAPCPQAGPGRCGGCDWQHASPEAQRALKASVVREQFARVARRPVDDLLAGVEELPGGMLGWRTRIGYAVDPDGRLGLRRHRSHDVQPLESCPIGAPGIGDAPALRERWPGVCDVEIVRGDGPEPATVSTRRSEWRRRRKANGQPEPEHLSIVSGPPRLFHQVDRRELTVDADGFWQVHPHALGWITRALLDGLEPGTGERVLELYCGSGPLTAALADAVGTRGAVLGLEGDRQAVRATEGNLEGLPQARVIRARVQARTVTSALEELGWTDLVVLDPPRAGAGRQVMAALLAAAPRAIGYVSCDPATLARDVRVALDAGWRLTSLRAVDAFPMTQHVECFAVLQPGAPQPAPEIGNT